MEHKVRKRTETFISPFAARLGLLIVILLFLDILVQFYVLLTYILVQACK